MELTDSVHKPVPHIVIESRAKWKLFDFKELWHYKDLFYFLVLRDITVVYKQTVLGFAWAILNPFFTMVVFSVVFGKLAKVDTNGVPYPIFSFAALVPWTYFSQSLSTSTNSLISQANLLSKVYFPRMFIPLTPVFAKLADFFIAFSIMVIMMFAYGYAPTWNALWLPYLILVMMLTSAGIGLWLSSMAIQYRDIKFAITFLLQLLMYGAPVIYSIAKLNDQLASVSYGPIVKVLYGLYPMVGVIEGFRVALVGGAPMPYDFILIGSISSVLIFISGLYYFRRTERIFADVA
jgi:lipopolysaccharide transport system permease protein